jgi:hypothetical protein
VDEDLTNLVCDACIVRPEARRLGILLPLSKVAMTPPKLSQELESKHSSNIAVQKVVRSRTGQSMLEAVTDMPEGDTSEAPLSSGGSREFSPAEKSLIRGVHGHMTTQRLLDLLNDRLATSYGAKATLHTMESLYAEISKLSLIAVDGQHDRASMRKLVQKARASGLLARVDEQLIDDFAVIFSLNARQVLLLKDIVANENAEAR